ncbi:MAG TPA: DsrE family protein [Nitrospiria bacterium]|nr:DsrE family protein [Nitrospiria bacterium]
MSKKATGFFLSVEGELKSVGAGKRVAVIVRNSPFNTLKSVEAFRMSIGLTLEGNQVDLLLMEAGVYNALPSVSTTIKRPDMNQFIDTMELCGIGVYLESEALPLPLHSKIRPQMTKKSRKELMEMIHRADVVIPF